jgi:hypothetical protein
MDQVVISSLTVPATAQHGRRGTYFQKPALIIQETFLEPK